MKEGFESSLVKICESLPFTLTLFENDGICVKPNDECMYCDNLNYRAFCKKKEYDIDSKFKNP